MGSEGQGPKSSSHLLTLILTARCSPLPMPPLAVRPEQRPQALRAHRPPHPASRRPGGLTIPGKLCLELTGNCLDLTVPPFVCGTPAPPPLPLRSAHRIWPVWMSASTNSTLELTVPPSVRHSLTNPQPHGPPPPLPFRSRTSNRAVWMSASTSSTASWARRRSLHPLLAGTTVTTGTETVTVTGR